MLNLPRRKPIPDIPVFGSPLPKPEEIIILPAPLLGAAIKIGKALNSVHAKWAFGGDAGEVMLGVNVHPDRLEILTTKEGTDEICGILADHVTVAPAVMEKKLAREADIDAKMLPVYIKSYYAELSVDEAKVEIYGDEQIKVWEWEWGDPLDYQAELVNILGTRVPAVPLRLKSELDLGLGWLDRVELISDAVMRSQHRH